MTKEEKGDLLDLTLSVMHELEQAELQISRAKEKVRTLSETQFAEWRKS